MAQTADIQRLSNTQDADAQQQKRESGKQLKHLINKSIMKKLFLIGALAVAMAAGAQVVTLDKLTKVDLPENANQKVAGISPDGSYILLTNQNNAGLSQYSLATKELKQITVAEGAGHGAMVAADGKTVMFKAVTFDANKQRMVSMQQKDLQTGKEKLLQRAHRQLAPMNMAMEVGVQNGQLVLTVAGRTKVLSPNGTSRSYIWPSLSPDKQHILYYVCGVGAFVCDIQGQNVQFIGHDLRAPKWLSNSTIVAMNDKDNGDYVVSSSIVVANLQGQMQTLTDEKLVLMYPYASANGKMVVCSAANGDVYTITLK